MEDYYEYLDSNGVTTLYKLIKDDTVALIDGYSVTLNGITTNLDNHINNIDIHTPITDIESMVDTKISGLVNSAPETLDTLKELSDALGNDPNFATTVANQIGTKASKDSVYTKLETDTLLEDKANSEHSHVVNDITDFPTIPTKLSQLENDMGFTAGSASSVPWSGVTDKPSIPTKTSDLTNDSDFAIDDDVVHTSGNETIDGTKTFTSGLWVTNSDTTLGYSIKNIAIARNDIPSEYYHHTFRAYDKNSKIMGEYCIEKATTGDALLNMGVRSEDASGTQISYGMQFRMTNDGSLVRFMPSANNKVHLGDPNAKWSSVHVTYTYTNKVTTYSITHPTDDSYFFMSGGTDYNKGATLYLGGVSATNFTPGRFILSARKTDGSSIELVGSPDGTLKWNSKNIAIDENLVHTSGNETISGAKIFFNDIFRKNTSVDLTVTPTGYTNTSIVFADKNDKQIALIEFVQRPSGVNDVGIFARDKNGNAHGIHINTNNEVIPLMGSSESYSLGSATYKWGKVHSDDVVHTSGNENIDGTKKFTSDIVRKYTAVDITTTPTSDMYAHINFTDKNDKTVAYIQYAQRSNGVDYIGLRVRDKNSNTWGVQLNTNKEFVPLGNNSYSLGSANYKWSKVYSDDIVHTSGAETINGAKTFTNDIFYKNSNLDLTATPTSNTYANFIFRDKNNKTLSYLQYGKQTSGNGVVGLYLYDSSQVLHGLQITSDNYVQPIANNVYSIGSAGAKWKKVYSDDIVHTSGNETISGIKTFSSITVSNKQLRYVDTQYNWTDTSLKTWCDAGHVAWYDKTGSKRMHELVGANGGVWRKACYINENQYFSVDSNRNISYWGSTTFNGNVLFTQDMYFKNNNIDLTVTPSSTLYSNFIFKDKNNQNVSYIQYAKCNTEPDILGLYINDKDKNLHGIQITSNNYVLPYGNNIYSLGSSNNKWSNVYATAFNGNLKGNADSSTKASYLDNYSVPGTNKIYLDWDTQVKSYVGLKVDNTVMGGLITTKNIGSQAANSATYATTQATTDNSTKIATTAWVRTYVDSVVGTGSIGASVSAYYSNATTLTAEGSSSSSGGSYPSDYSDYINISPTVGTIYTGSQLFGTLNASASGSKYSYSSSGSTVYQTTAKATATFSGAFSSSAKYLCTTANAVKFRAYVSQGTSSTMGSPSVVDQSSSKSIFIRVQ